MSAPARGHCHPARPGADAGAVVDAALRASVEYAFAHPEASRDYVAAHAQEMDPDVMARHIRLYVNDYTRALDEDAVHRDVAWAESEVCSRPGPGRCRYSCRTPRPQDLKTPGPQDPKTPRPLKQDLKVLKTPGPLLIHSAA